MSDINEEQMTEIPHVEFMTDISSFPMEEEGDRQTIEEECQESKTKEKNKKKKNKKSLVKNKSEKILVDDGKRESEYIEIDFPISSEEEKKKYYDALQGREPLQEENIASVGKILNEISQKSKELSSMAKNKKAPDGIYTKEWEESIVSFFALKEKELAMIISSKLIDNWDKGKTSTSNGTAYRTIEKIYKEYFIVGYARDEASKPSSLAIEDSIVFSDVLLEDELYASSTLIDPIFAEIRKVVDEPTEEAVISNLEEMFTGNDLYIEKICKVFAF